MEITITVVTPTNAYTFTAITHRTLSAKGRLLGKDFYRKSCTSKRAFSGVHFELELLDTALGSLPALEKCIYTSTTSERFFANCIHRLPTFWKAVDFFERWCVNAAHLLSGGDDIADLALLQSEQFLHEMATRYEVRPRYYYFGLGH